MSEQTQDNIDQIFVDETEKKIEVKDNENSDNLTETPKVTTGEQEASNKLSLKNRDKQLEVWADRVEKGEVNLSELPKNLNWLKPLIEEEIATRVNKQDVDALVEAKINQIRESEAKIEQEKRFDSLKSKANSAEFSAETKALIQEGFTRLVSKGMTEADALEESLNIYDIVNQSGEIAVKELQKRMNIPTQNQPKPENIQFGDDNFSKQGDSKSRVEKMENQLRQSGLSN